MKITQIMTYTRESVETMANAYITTKGYKIIKYFCIVLGVLLVLLSRSTIFKHPMIWAIVGLLIVFLGYLFPYVIKVRIMNANEKNIGKKATIILTDDAISTKSSNGNGSYRWSDVATIKVFADCLILILKNRRIILLKSSSLSQEEIQWVTSHK